MILETCSEERIEFILPTVQSVPGNSHNAMEAVTIRTGSGHSHCSSCARRKSGSATIIPVSSKLDRQSSMKPDAVTPRAATRSLSCEIISQSSADMVSQESNTGVVTRESSAESLLNQAEAANFLVDAAVRRCEDGMFVIMEAQGETSARVRSLEDECKRLSFDNVRLRDSLQSLTRLVEHLSSQIQSRQQGESSLVGALDAMRADTSALQTMMHAVAGPVRLGRALAAEPPVNVRPGAAELAFSARVSTRASTASSSHVQSSSGQSSSTHAQRVAASPPVAKLGSLGVSPGYTPSPVGARESHRNGSLRKESEGQVSSLSSGRGASPRDAQRAPLATYRTDLRLTPGGTRVSHASDTEDTSSSSAGVPPAAPLPELDSWTLALVGGRKSQGHDQGLLPPPTDGDADWQQQQQSTPMRMSRAMLAKLFGE